MSKKLKQNIILLIAMLSYFLTSLSNSIVITGLTNISHDLQINQVDLSWVQNAYGLAFGSFLLICGRLSDLFSRKIILNIGLIIFLIGSLASGISPNGLVMISARFLQGIGSALLAPTSMALLLDYFEGPNLVKAIAWYSSIAGLGASIGLVIGGIFASYMSWRIGFYLNIPLCIVMLLLSLWILDDNIIPTKDSFDIVGTISSVLGIGLLVYSLNGSPNPMTTLIISVAILVLFFINEKKVKKPILSTKIFNNWTRTNGYLSRAILNGAVMGYWFFISEYLQQKMNYSPFSIGLAYLPLSLTMFLGALIVPKMIDSMNNKRVLALGVLCELIGFIWSVVLLENDYWISIGIPMLIIGLGQGLALAPLTNMGIYKVNEKQSGIASGLVNTAHQLGGVLGLALMINLSSELFNQTSITGEFHSALMIAIVMVFAVLILSFTIKGNEL